MGKLVDLLVLSGLWVILSLPVVTIGASTAALYYVTLKLASNEEGYTVRSFFHAFKENLIPGIPLGIGSLAVGGDHPDGSLSDDGGLSLPADGTV